MTQPSSKTRELREEAIVLGSVDYGESDRIVTFFTRGMGKVGAFARGARASKKRFGGALEPFTRLELRLVPGRGELFHLASCSILDAFVGLRGSLQAIVYAGHAAELCRELCKEKQPHEELFDLLRDYLVELSNGHILKEDLLSFEIRAVGEAGFAPVLHGCARCGGAVRGERLLFDPFHGGLHCDACAATKLPEAFHVSAAAAALAKRLQEPHPFGSFPAADPTTLEETRRMFHQTTRAVLGKPPRSLALFHQLGID